MVPLQQHRYSTRTATPRGKPHGSPERIRNPVDYTTDGEFLKQSAKNNARLLEIVSRTKDHGSGADIRRAAGELLVVHTRFGEDLRRIAAKKHVSLPEQIRPAADSGLTFTDQVLNHCVIEIARFETEAKQGSDPDIRKWVANQIATFEKDRQMMETLKASHRRP